MIHLLRVAFDAYLDVVSQVCDALTANLEEKQFFRIRQPCSHAEVMLYLSTFAAAESFFVLVASGGFCAAALLLRINDVIGLGA